MTRGARLAAAAFAAGLAAGAGGFVQSTADTTGVPLSWPTNLVAYVVNSSNPHASPSCAAGAGGDPALAAVRAGFEAWHQECSALELVDGGTVGEIRIGRAGTGENLVVFRQGWCSAHPQASGHPCMTDPEVDCGGIFNCFEDHGAGDRSIVALTSVLYFPDTGRIVDADIELNGWSGAGAGALLSGAPHGWYFTCSDPVGQPCDRYGQDGCHFIDLQATVTHEVGHFIGLRHVCNGSPGGGGTDADLPRCNASHEPITMNPNTGIGDVEKRTLHEDDVAGVCAIYGSGRSLPSRSSGGGCSSAGAGGGLGLLAVAATLGVARRRRR